MMIVWEGLSAIGDSRALLPLVTVLAVFLPAMHRPLLRRWTVAIIAVAGATLASKIAFMGWGLGVESLDFTGISGHAAMSSAVYPVALWLLASGRSQRAWNWALAGMMLAMAIAISRFPLKAHSPSEILSGLGLGIVASIWVLRRSQALGQTLAVRIRTVVLAIVAAIGLPFLLADLHTHDLVKAAAKALSGRERALDRHDLRNHASPTDQRY
ncbi:MULTISPECIES: phosphatase PAP2 family protein [Stenotrophomonas]|uniref:phosphatase PAP2 family protein n=1 Tax=Stenotrophomonas TaxID=40323 RepID=UPI0009BE5878|nr:phosphatase PAP2 family protein [Stenotrophomonas maltophilia]HEL4844262.1 phosphatase PAP2 family protein [Stenotrophomonas maltophilia]HEL4847866.1 phosphatase PAP2 family protein [Stenotrophomonas maltophilia]